MTNPSLSELERHLESTALMSLDARGLLPQPGSGHCTRRSGVELADRVAGALAGAAVGSALGLRWEWQPRERIGSASEITDVGPRARYGADVQLLRASLEAQLDAGPAAAPHLARRLQRGLRLVQPGRAVPAAVARLAEGHAWFEAGVASFGSGAVVRAVAAGISHRTQPTIRPYIAAVDCAVTHASVQATAVAAGVADLIALFLDQDDQIDERTVLALLRATPQLRDVAEIVEQRLGQHQQPPAGAQAADVLAAALAHTLWQEGDAEAAILHAIAAGGDTDTTAALTGAFCGAIRGLDSVPAGWRASVGGVERLLALARRAAGESPNDPDAVVTTGTNGTRPGDRRADQLHISVLLDRSGSMQTIAADVVGGFNQFLSEHRAIPGCRLTLVQFDNMHPFEVLIDNVDVIEAPELRPEEFEPRGMTPLYDAIGALLDRAEQHPADDPQVDQVVVVFTDGLENASQRWTRADVFRRVAELQAEGWAFVFMGANQDSYAEGQRIGVGHGNTSNYQFDEDGVRAAWQSLSRASHEHASKPRARRHAEREEWFQGTKEAEWQR